jgi:tetratricopeptide (TPR) repeat protein
MDRQHTILSSHWCQPPVSYQSTTYIRVSNALKKNKPRLLLTYTPYHKNQHRCCGEYISEGSVMNENGNEKNEFELGIIEFAGGRYDESIALFTRAFDKDPDNALAVVSRGAAYFKQGNLDQAWSDFDRGIQIDPEYARAYHMRGLVYERLGEDEAALADFDRAIELNPEYGAAYYSRATLHTKLSNTEKAQADIETATIIGNQNLETYMSENNVWHTQQMRVEDALETELER